MFIDPVIYRQLSVLLPRIMKQLNIPHSLIEHFPRYWNFVDAQRINYKIVFLITFNKISCISYDYVMNEVQTFITNFIMLYNEDDDSITTIYSKPFETSVTIEDFVTDGENISVVPFIFGEENKLKQVDIALSKELGITKDSIFIPNIEGAVLRIFKVDDKIFISSSKVLDTVKEKTRFGSSPIFYDILNTLFPQYKDLNFENRVHFIKLVHPDLQSITKIYPNLTCVLYLGYTATNKSTNETKNETLNESPNYFDPEKLEPFCSFFFHPVSKLVPIKFSEAKDFLHMKGAYTRIIEQQADKEEVAKTLQEVKSRKRYNKYIDIFNGESIIYYPSCSSNPSDPSGTSVSKETSYSFDQTNIDKTILIFSQGYEFRKYIFDVIDGDIRHKINILYNSPEKKIKRHLKLSCIFFSDVLIKNVYNGIRLRDILNSSDIFSSLILPIRKVKYQIDDDSFENLSDCYVANLFNACSKRKQEELLEIFETYEGYIESPPGVFRSCHDEEDEDENEEAKETKQGSEENNEENENEAKQAISRSGVTPKQGSEAKESQLKIQTSFNPFHSPPSTISPAGNHPFAPPPSPAIRSSSPAL